MRRTVRALGIPNRHGRSNLRAIAAYVGGGWLSRCELVDPEPVLIQEYQRR